MKQYFMPVRLWIGRGCVAEHAEELCEFGHKAMIVTGRHSAKACGALDDVLATLEKNGQEAVIFDRVMNNPTVECVYEGAAFAKEHNAEFVIAIGGGSPMDAAKAMALLAKNDIPKEKIFMGVSGLAALPMVHIATTAGTGSEVTPYAILTNPEKQTKTSIASPTLFPKLSFLDASYLEALPRASMIHTVLDSLSHSMEGMLSVRADSLTDGMACKAISMISGCFQHLLSDALTQEELEALLLASTLGGMVISNTGTTVVHSMGYSLTYFKGDDHGRANGRVLPAFLKLAKVSHPQIIAQMEKALGMDLDAFGEVVAKLLGPSEPLSEEEVSAYTALAKNSKNIKNCVVPITEEEIRQLFVQA